MVPNLSPELYHRYVCIGKTIYPVFVLSLFQTSTGGLGLVPCRYGEGKDYCTLRLLHLALF